MKKQERIEWEKQQHKECLAKLEALPDNMEEHGYQY